MKNAFCRIAISVSTAVFAAMFFLPSDSTRTPFEAVKWVLDTGSLQTGIFGHACYYSIAAVIVYPYLWSLLVALTAMLGVKIRRLENHWLHFLFHAVAGLLIVALSIVLLALDDAWIPQWSKRAGIIVPFVILGLMFGASLMMSPSKKTWAIVALGFLPQIPVQILLADFCAGLEDRAWGFILAGICAGFATVFAVLLSLPHPVRPANRT